MSARIIATAIGWTMIRLAGFARLAVVGGRREVICLLDEFRVHVGRGARYDRQQISKADLLRFEYGL